MSHETENRQLNRPLGLRPDPDCEACHGAGEYYTHSPDCENDLCALAAGLDDCKGMVVECDCVDPEQAAREKELLAGLVAARDIMVVAPEALKRLTPHQITSWMLDHGWTRVRDAEGHVPPMYEHPWEFVPKRAYFPFSPGFDFVPELLIVLARTEALKREAGCTQGEVFAEMLAYPAEDQPCLFE